MNLQNIVVHLIVLFIAIALGFVARKIKIMNDDFDGRLSRIVLDVTLPCMILAAVLSNESLPDSQSVLSILGFSAIGYLVILVIAVVAPIILRFPKNDRGTYSFMMAFGNVGFIGFPVLSAVFGQDAILYAAVFNIPFNLLVFTVGVFFLSDPNNNLKNRLLAGAKNALSPTLAACIIAVALALLRITDSGIIGQATNIVGQMTTPAALLLIGSTLAKYPVHDMLVNIRAYVSSAFKLLVMPLALYFAFRGFLADPLLLGTIVITAGMPVATNGTLLCLRFGGNLKVMLQGTFISTVFSMLTIPMLAMLFA